MQWLRLGFDCDAEQVDALAELLERLGAESLSISGGARVAPTAGFGQAPACRPDSRVSALLPMGSDLDIILACLRNRAGSAGLRNASITPLLDRDWVAAGREAHGPMLFGDRLCICPSWASAPAGKRVLTLDPGLAFGTGAHATTALCLEWIAERDWSGREVIDYGCGSGVLALAAAALGAMRVLAIDLDPVAVTVAADNTRRNGLAAIVSAAEPDAAAPGPADLLLANILLGPLLDLAPRFAALVKPEGEILLSGILATQAETCLGRYARWFNMAPPRFRAEWALLTGRRRAAEEG